MATNHLGTPRWCRALAAAAGERSRVVAGGEHRGARGQLSPRRLGAAAQPGAVRRPPVYRNTKQANLLFAQELHRRCGKAGSPVSAVAVHPGASATNLSPASWSGRSVRAGASQQGRALGCCFSRRRRARCPRFGRSTPTRRAALSSAPPDSANFAAGRSSSTYTPPPRTRPQPRACGSSPSRRSAGRYRSEVARASV